ncbi:MAG TPA: aspartyl protease family protein [Thioalkalivibrio sp.]|nr:aspartyl protease family protein [Thioalkalivibrio sp.]
MRVEDATFAHRRVQSRALLLVALASIAWLFPAHLFAREVIVLGVFPDRALVEVDGSRKVLIAGDQGTGGLRLLSTDTRRATVWLEIDGVRAEFAAEPTTGARGTPRAKGSARLFLDSRGRYGAPGSINGRAVSFVLDSGRPVLLLPQREAERLRIDTDAAPTVAMQTESGVVFGHRVLLDRVQLGDLHVRSVEGWVVPGDDSRYITLGRSFLDRVTRRQEKGAVVLEEKR